MPRNLKLSNAMKEERRKKILAGALRLFATKGLAATKIADIAKETSMSQGLVYHYWPNKNVIFTELIQTAFERITEASEWLLNQPISAKEKITMAIHELLHGLHSNPETAQYHLLIANATASSAIPEEAKKIMKEKSPVPYQIMSQIFKQGQIEGSVRDFPADELALVFWTSVKGLAIHQATHPGNTIRPQSKILINTFLEENR